MKKMIRFEIKKAFDKKILFSVIVLLVINVCYIVLSNYNEEMKDFYYGKTQIVNKVNGKITQEKVNFLLDGLEKNKNLVENGDFDTEKKDKNTYEQKIDSGIIMLFFQLMVSATLFDLKWKLEPPTDSLEIPEEFEIVAYCMV